MLSSCIESPLAGFFAGLSCSGEESLFAGQSLVGLNQDSNQSQYLMLLLFLKLGLSDEYTAPSRFNESKGDQIVSIDRDDITIERHVRLI